jgi:hypothetical protein
MTMTQDEAGLLLVHSAAYDKRTIGEPDVLAWHRALGDLSFTACQDAIDAYYREHREPIMPSDIRHGVREARPKPYERTVAQAIAESRGPGEEDMSDEEARAYLDEVAARYGKQEVTP